MEHDHNVSTEIPKYIFHFGRSTEDVPAEESLHGESKEHDNRLHFPCFFASYGCRVALSDRGSRQQHAMVHVDSVRGLTHVGMHMEATLQDGELIVDPVDWQVDQVTEDFMSSIGVLVWYGEHMLLASIVEQAKRSTEERVDMTGRKRQRDIDHELSQGDRKRMAATELLSPDEARSFRPEALLMSSWNANLLSQWSGKRDRINRWMLHCLGCDAEQANLYRRIVRKEAGTNLEIADLHTQVISAGHVVKHWFGDEAAVAAATVYAPCNAISGGQAVR